MRALVTGASGFVGALLIPRLLAGGDAVRAFARSPDRVRAALSWQMTESQIARLDVEQGDAVTGSGLARALRDVEVAYYLIHSMERAPGDALPFAERERLAAERFADAAVTAGVRRIVYLGGLVPRWHRDPAGGDDPGSRHLRSREHVERIILDAVPDSVALRASIVIGARSRSFRLMVRLVERLPVLTLPAWRRHRTQPIDQRDVVELLAASAHAPLGGRALDVGGPDVLSYGEMLSRIAELMLISRPELGLGVNLTPMTARLAAAIASEDPELVLPLMEGLEGDLLAADEGVARELGIRLHSFDAAVEHALAEWEQHEPLAAR
jgi:uncharacterized protein YbjT (DUF2867 family)